MSVVSDDIEPLTFVFADDGLVPNNPLPFLVYKSAVDVANDHPEKTIEGLFGANGWGAMWRNGVFDLSALPCDRARGARRRPRPCARAVRRRPRQGARNLRRRRCDPARRHRPSMPVGTADDFCVVGAYPPGPPMQITRPTPENHAKALKTIPQVKVPETDPVMGADGPLVRLWKS